MEDNSPALLLTYKKWIGDTSPRGSTPTAERTAFLVPTRSSHKPPEMLVNGRDAKDMQEELTRRDIRLFRSTQHACFSCPTDSA